MHNLRVIRFRGCFSIYVLGFFKNFGSFYAFIASLLGTLCLSWKFFAPVQHILLRLRVLFCFVFYRMFYIPVTHIFKILVFVGVCPISVLHMIRSDFTYRLFFDVRSTCVFFFKKKSLYYLLRIG